MTFNFFQENGCYEVMTPEWQMISCPGGKTSWKLNSDIDLKNESFRGFGNGLFGGNSVFSSFGGK